MPELNTGRLEAGTRTLERLLSHKELLSKDTPNGLVYDEAFHSDVARDLATFYARGTISQGEIARYRQLIPQNQRKELMLNFAEEADRVGQKSSARQIYNAYLQEPGLTPQEKTDVMVRLTLVQYDIGNQSVDDFANAAKTFRNTGCKDAEACEKIRKSLRKYVTELHRANKTRPNNNIVRAYIIYSETFPDDAEMSILGAQVAVDLKNYDTAVTLYRRGADGARSEADKSVAAKHLNTALLGEVEAAELSKKFDLRESAYKHYLSIFPTGEKSFEIRYQLAQVSYERKLWSHAAEAFKSLALDTSGTESLRKKSADLALDCLAIEKRDQDIETWSMGFARVFPKHAAEYSKLARKSVTNQIARVANDKKSSNSELTSAISKLRSTSLAGATVDERKIHFKNLSVLAERADDDGTLMHALDGLLSIKTVSASEREEALARKVGYFETRLDFAQAYRIAKQMRLSSLSKADRDLRLGTLADMAGLNPRAHYEAYIRSVPSGPKSRVTRMRLIALSRAPMAELRRHAPELQRDSKLFSEALLLAFSKSRNTNEVNAHLNRGSIAHTAAGKMIKKQFFFGEHAQLDRKISAHRLRSSSQASLQKSIADRMALLLEADKLLKKALSLNDFTSAVLALTTVTRENNRLVSDLMSLPAPRGLKPQELAQYNAILKAKAQPFLAKAQTANAKLSEFWNNSRALDAIVADYTNSRTEVKALFAREIQLLAAQSTSQRGSLLSALNSSSASPSDLASARRAVSQDPRNLSDIQKLISLETKIGNPMIASYMERRLDQLKSRGMP